MLSSKARVQAYGSNTRRSELPGSSQVLLGGYVEERKDLRVPCVNHESSPWSLLTLILYWDSPVFKRGKSTPVLGAFHSTDIPEFYGTGDSPDFIATDALGMCLQRPVNRLILTLYDANSQLCPYRRP